MSAVTSPDRDMLPDSAIPSHYELLLEPDLEAFTFSGSVTIDIIAKEPTDTLTIHANEIEVQQATVDGKNPATEINYNKKTETVSFAFRDAVTGTAQLTILFTGVLNDAMAGFYRSKYTTPEGTEKYMACTQFEATDARRAFPCWDEPARKATFSVTMVVPAGLRALGNMPPVSNEGRDDGSTLVRFDTTPVMSTYLLAFVIGEFDTITGTTKHGVDVHVSAPVGQKEEGRFPLECAIKTLEYFSEFFDQPYPLPKLDMIAIADFAAGAMENWGLVTYRTTYLLYDDNRTSLKDKMLIAYVVCHELAHQWFGNLVTMGWWTHLWLNEGFATWVGWLAVDHMFPEWRIWDRFVGEELERALDLDALRSSHAIEVECKNSADVNEIFDAISYSKGASVIRMLADIIGVEAFQKGLQKYISVHKYANAESSDLWAALTESSGTDVAALMGPWTTQVGYPVVTLSLEAGTNEVLGAQRRFLATGPDATDTTVWPIPIGAVMSGGEPSTSIHATTIFRTGSILSEGAWVKANRHMTGIFRVEYDEALLTRLVGAIPELDNRDRYELISDAFATAKAGYSDTAAALTLLGGYGSEVCETVMSLISLRLGELQSVMADEPSEVQEQLRVFSLGIFGAQAARLGWSVKPAELHSDSMLRPSMIRRAGLLGDQGIVAECKSRFDAFAAGDHDSINPDLRGAVYSTVMKYGGIPEFDTLVKLYSEFDAQDQKVTILRSMGSAKLPEVHAAIVSWAMSGAVRDQDITSVVGPLAANPGARTFMWSWFKAHYNELHKRFYTGSFLFGRIVSAVCQPFATEEAASEMSLYFSQSELPTDAVKRAIEQSIESVHANAKWLNQCRGPVSDWLASHVDGGI